MEEPMFTVEELNLPGVLRITPQVRHDERGFSASVYSTGILTAYGVSTSFVQDFTSHSRKNVIRGLHYQRSPHAQSKLVRCTKGKIFDVVADCNPQSSTFGQHISVLLKGDEQTLLYIPGIYAHGYCVLSDEAIVEYKLSDIYYPELVEGIRFDDPNLNIDWPVSNPILSKSDQSWPALIQINSS